MKTFFTKHLSIYLSIYLSVVCAEIQAQAFSWEVDCFNPQNSTAIFTFPLSLGVISSTPIIEGGPDLVSVTNEGQNQIVSMIFDGYQMNECIISFLLSDGSIFTSDPVIFDMTIDTNSLSPLIIPDCGQETNSGQVIFNIGDGIDLNLWWGELGGFDFNGQEYFNSIIQLSPAIYIVVAQDPLCLNSSFWQIQIPVSPITVTIDQVTPISVCTSQTVQASGMTEGGVQGTISGGSGAFTVLFSDQSGYQLPTEDFFYGGIDNGGVYSFDIQDDVTNCIISGNYTIPQVDVQVDILVSETQQLITNGNIVLQTATLEADLVFSNGMEPAEFYEWSPIGFLDDDEGMYSEIDTEGTYTVNVDVFGGSCSASTTFEVVSTLCILEGDINLDGIVNGADLIALLGSFGMICNSSDPCPGDINHDGVVNQQDVLAFFGTYGLSWESVCGSN